MNDKEKEEEEEEVENTFVQQQSTSETVNRAQYTYRIEIRLTY